MAERPHPGRHGGVAGPGEGGIADPHSRRGASLSRQLPQRRDGQPRIFQFPRRKTVEADREHDAVPGGKG